ncbi:MAG: transcriptional regulator GlxA family with amidase domain [Cryomorphaceae bacterium]
MNLTAKTQKVTILALSDSSMMTFSSIIDPLRAANRLSRMALFSWEIVSLTGKAIRLTCGVEIQVDGSFSKHSGGDLLVVIAGFDHERQTSKKNLVDLHSAASHYKTICGVEAGTWLLAKAGIATHHKVTTHWEDLENFALKFPSLEVSAERYVIDHNIWTCGGASPAFDMMLQYLRATQNKSLALDVASAFVYVEASSATDAQANISLGRLEKTAPRLANAIKSMEANIEDPIPIGQIAKRVGVSAKTMENLFRKHLGITPGNYYLRLRLQTARRLTLDSDLSILDIAIRSGFNSQSALSRAFGKRYGQSPMNLRKSAV